MKHIKINYAYKATRKIQCFNSNNIFPSKFKYKVNKKNISKKLTFNKINIQSKNIKKIKKCDYFENVLYCNHCHKMSTYSDYIKFDKIISNSDKKRYAKIVNRISLRLSIDNFLYDSQHFPNLIESIAEFAENESSFVNNKNFIEIKKVIDEIKFEKRTKNQILLKCPCCNNIIKNKDIKILSKSKNWMEQNSYLHAYDISEKENKIILSAFYYSVYPVTASEKIKYYNINVRFVFNKDDCNTYAFCAHDTDKKRPLNKEDKRILNITYLTNSLNFMSCFHEKAMKNKYILTDLYLFFHELYGMTLDEDISSRKLDFNDLLLFFRYHNYDEHFRNLIKNITRNNICIEPSAKQKQKVMLQEIFKMQDDRDFMIKIIKQKKAPMKKRFIRMAAKNPFYIYYYKVLKNIYFKDYNIMLNILEESSYNMTSFFMKCYIEGISSKAKIFFRDILSVKGEVSAKKMITDFIELRTSDYLFQDTIEMYYQFYLAENIDEKSFIDKSLLKMHDELSSNIYKIKQKNKIIEYSKSDLTLNEDISNYSFRLAPNSYSLIECGQKMGICVGGYGNKASNKECIIVFLFKENKFAGCIELSPDKKRLIQAKAKFNNILQEEKATILKYWIEKNKIDAVLCFDYSHILKNNIEYDISKLYQEKFNYSGENISEEEQNKEVNIDYIYNIVN